MTLILIINYVIENILIEDPSKTNDTPHSTDTTVTPKPWFITHFHETSVPKKRNNQEKSIFNSYFGDLGVPIGVDFADGE